MKNVSCRVGVQVPLVMEDRERIAHFMSIAHKVPGGPSAAITAGPSRASSASASEAGVASVPSLGAQSHASSMSGGVPMLTNVFGSLGLLGSSTKHSEEAALRTASAGCGDIDNHALRLPVQLSCTTVTTMRCTCLVHTSEHLSIAIVTNLLDFTPHLPSDLQNI